MSVLGLLVPTSIILGLIGLAAFLWNVRSGQYEDLLGSAERVLLDEEDEPLPTRSDSGAGQPASDPGRGR